MSSPVAAKLAWYAARAGRMSPAEVAWRARDQALRLAWQRRQVRPGQPAPALPPGERGFTAVLLPGTEALVPGPARDAVLASRQGAAGRRVGRAGRGADRPGRAGLVP